jgi:uncharacterized membrane protein YuzA (DUF378 family)
MLGVDCFVLLLFLFWCWLQLKPATPGKAKSKETRLIYALFVMGIWCLYKAHSFTSWVGLVGGALTMIVVGLPSFNRKSVGKYALAALLFIVTAQITFDVVSVIQELRGKETYDGRGELWSILLSAGINPIIGVGFESFWMGPRVQTLWSMPQFRTWKPNEAHNGYLEIYLNLGIIGLFAFAMLIHEVFGKSKRELLDDFRWGRYRFGFLIALLAYNWTEAGFRGLSVAYFVLFLLASTYRRVQHEPVVFPIFQGIQIDPKAPWRRLTAS